MKFMLSFLPLLFSTHLLCQGAQFSWFVFANGGVVNAPVADVDGLTPLEGDGYKAQAYVGFTSGSLQPLLPMTTFALRGRIHPVDIFVPGGQAGQIVFVQLAVWEAAKGATFEEAVLAGSKYGRSNIVPVGLGDPPFPPIGMQSFSLVPEPSTWRLLVCGLALLLGSFPGVSRT